MKALFQIIDKRNYRNIELDESFLCPRDLDRYKNISNNAKKFEFLLGRNFLRCLLENFENKNYDILELEFSENDKPSLKNSNIHFNLSHSNNYLVMLLSENPCGVDLQKLEKLVKSERLWERISHPNEISKNEDLTESLILEHWTAKEALTKCLGGGFSHSFQKIDLSCLPESPIFNYNDKLYNLRSINTEKLDDTYFCTVAIEQEDDRELMSLEEVDWY